MTIQLSAPSQPIYYPAGLITPGFTNYTALDGTTTKLALSGQVFIPTRGSKDITRVGLLFGSAITKAGGSGLTVSLQDVNAAAGTPMQPDETQDQTVAIANAAITADTWIRTGTLSANRTVTHGDLLSVVVEYDGGGRLGADSITFKGQTAGSPYMRCVPIVKTSGTWTLLTTAFANVILEFTDGTFGTLRGAIPISAVNIHTYRQDTTVADEYALAFQVSYPCSIDEGIANLNINASTSDFSVVLYDGTTALATLAVDANQMAIAASTTRFSQFGFSAENALLPNRQYYLAFKPTQSTTTITVYSYDVNDAAHLACHPGGQNFNYATRLDLGSWAAITTTRRLVAGIGLSSVGNAGGVPTSSFGLGGVLNV